MSKEKYNKGLDKTKKSLLSKLKDVFSSNKIDDDLYEELIEVLILSDIPFSVSEEIIENVKENATKKDVKDINKLYDLIKEEIKNRLKLNLWDKEIKKPALILFIGVNGAGKTTTIAKLANKFLKEDKKVIFIGTPCQIQGLNKYLEIKNINKSNLITVDLVCHGVPSQQYLTNYINYLEKKYKCKATNVSFRDSEKYIFKLLDKNKIIVSIPNTKDLYLKAFGLSMIQRESCLECKYASPNRVSDITIGDFWGIQNDSKINNEEKEKGISLVLINTEKGKSFFENCTSNIFYEERNIEEAINGNAHLRRTSPKNKFRIKFREQYNSDFVRSAKKTIGFAMLKENVKLYLIKIKHIFFKGDQL